MPLAVALMAMIDFGGRHVLGQVEVVDANFMRRLRHLRVQVIGQAGQHRLELRECLANLRTRRQVRRLDGERQFLLRCPGIETRDVKAASRRNVAASAPTLPRPSTAIFLNDISGS